MAIPNCFGSIPLDEFLCKVLTKAVHLIKEETASINKTDVEAVQPNGLKQRTLDQWLKKDAKSPTKCTTSVSKLNVISKPTNAYKEINKQVSCLEYCNGDSDIVLISTASKPSGDNSQLESSKSICNEVILQNHTDSTATKVRIDKAIVTDSNLPNTTVSGRGEPTSQALSGKLVTVESSGEILDKTKSHSDADLKTDNSCFSTSVAENTVKEPQNPQLSDVISVQITRAKRPIARKGCTCPCDRTVKLSCTEVSNSAPCTEKAIKTGKINCNNFIDQKNRVITSCISESQKSSNPVLVCKLPNSDVQKCKRKRKNDSQLLDLKRKIRSKVKKRKEGMKMEEELRKSSEEKANQSDRNGRDSIKEKDSFAATSNYFYKLRSSRVNGSRYANLEPFLNMLNSKSEMNGNSSLAYLSASKTHASDLAALLGRDVYLSNGTMDWRELDMLADLANKANCNSLTTTASDKEGSKSPSSVEVSGCTLSPKSQNYHSLLSSPKIEENQNKKNKNLKINASCDKTVGETICSVNVGTGRSNPYLKKIKSKKCVDSKTTDNLVSAKELLDVPKIKKSVKEKRAKAPVEVSKHSTDNADKQLEGNFNSTTSTSSPETTKQKSHDFSSNASTSNPESTKQKQESQSFSNSASTNSPESINHKQESQGFNSTVPTSNHKSTKRKKENQKVVHAKQKCMEQCRNVEIPRENEIKSPTVILLRPQTRNQTKATKNLPVDAYSNVQHMDIIKDSSMQDTITTEVQTNQLSTCSPEISNIPLVPLSINDVGHNKDSLSSQYYNLCIRPNSTSNNLNSELPNKTVMSGTHDHSDMKLMSEFKKLGCKLKGVLCNSEIQGLITNSAKSGASPGWVFIAPHLSKDGVMVGPSLFLVKSKLCCVLSTKSEEEENIPKSTDSSS